MNITVDKFALRNAFNEWMRRFTENPDEFDADLEKLSKEFKEQQDDGIEPTYGDLCANYLIQIMAELG